MIKLIAALTMLIDHIGVILYPTTFMFRAIGRLSMPLFAYCVARGFYYSNQHNTVKKYIVNMLIFALISQIPFIKMNGGGWNIGFTWLFSLLLLIISNGKYDMPWKRILSISIASILIFILVEINYFSVDYGIYGITLPLLFFFLIQKKKENTMNYVLVLLIAWAGYVLVNREGITQIISVLSGLILTVSAKYDKKVKLPKWVFYTFYPVHIVILLIIKMNLN